MIVAKIINPFHENIYEHIGELKYKTTAQDIKADYVNFMEIIQDYQQACYHMAAIGERERPDLLKEFSVLVYEATKEIYKLPSCYLLHGMLVTWRELARYKRFKADHKLKAAVNNSPILFKKYSFRVKAAGEHYFILELPYLPRPEGEKCCPSLELFLPISNMYVYEQVRAIAEKDVLLTQLLLTRDTDGWRATIDYKENTKRKRRKKETLNIKVNLNNIRLINQYTDEQFFELKKAITDGIKYKCKKARRKGLILNSNFHIDVIINEKISRVRPLKEKT